MNRPWRRAGVLAGVLVVLAAGLWTVRAPILRAIGHQLVHSDPVEPGDAIVVLAGGQLDRELEAADLFARGLAPVVVLTREPEARMLGVLRNRGVHLDDSLEVRTRVLVSLGVPPPSVVILDGVVQSTHDEAVLARAWASRRSASRLIVVTSSFHTARARREFLRVFQDSGVRVSMVAASASDFDPDTWWTDRTNLRQGLFEWQKTVFYWVWY